MIKIPNSYDVIGDIAILKFDEKTTAKDKEEIADLLLKDRKAVKTVLEKTEKVKGKLRVFKTNYIAGENKTETLHRESGCIFKLDVSKCYFSPRLSNERLQIANKIKKKDSVLVMFAGVSPYAVVISKIANPSRIISTELGRECCRYGKENVRLNKVEGKIEILQGDSKKVIPRLKEKFSVIVMPRPQLDYSFLKEAFSVSKKGTRIFYRAFEKEEELETVKKEIEKEAKAKRFKIKIVSVTKAGEIAPYKFRWMIELKVL